MKADEAIEIMMNRKYEEKMAEFKALTGFSYENFKKLLLAGVISITSKNRSIYDLIRICDGGMTDDYIRSETERRGMDLSNMIETSKRYVVTENMVKATENMVEASKKHKAEVLRRHVELNRYYSQSKIDKKDDE